MANERRQSSIGITTQQSERFRTLNRYWLGRKLNTTEQMDYYVNKALELAEEDQAQWEQSSGQQ